MSSSNSAIAAPVTNVDWMNFMDAPQQPSSCEEEQTEPNRWATLMTQHAQLEAAKPQETEDMEEKEQKEEKEEADEEVEDDEEEAGYQGKEDGEEEEESYELPEEDNVSSSSDEEDELPIPRTIGVCIVCEKNSTTPPAYCGRCYRSYRCCEGCWSTYLGSTHYLECQRQNSSHRTSRQQNELNKFYQKYEVNYSNGFGCRHCGKVELDGYPGDCSKCYKMFYCDDKCRDADKERHVKDEECQISEKLAAAVVAPLPPNFQAASVRASKIIPELIAHSLSFLSWFDWSDAACVNHAWRNASLLPSSSSHEMKVIYSRDVETYPHARSHFLSVHDSSFPTDVTGLPHVRSYYQNCEATREPQQFDSLIPICSTLTAMNLPVSVLLTSPKLLATHFYRLRVLSLNNGWFGWNYLTPDSVDAIVQLTELRVLRVATLILAMEERPVDDNQWAPKDLTFEQLSRSRAHFRRLVHGIGAVCHHLHTLDLAHSEVVLAEDAPSFPLVTRLTLHARMNADTKTEDVTGFSRLGQKFPRLTRLVLFNTISTCVLVQKEYEEVRHALISALRNGVSTGLALESFHLLLREFAHTHHREVPSRQKGAQQLWKIFSRSLSGEYETTSLSSCSSSSLSLKQCFIQFSDNYGAEMAAIESSELDHLTLRYPHLESMQLYVDRDLVSVDLSQSIAEVANKSSLKYLSICGAERLRQQPTINFPPLPSSHHGLLSGGQVATSLRILQLSSIDIDVTLPSLLRLLPPIDTIIVSGLQLSVHQFFQFAQHRPILITGTLGYSSYDVPYIGEMRTIDASEIDYFDQDEYRVEQLGVAHSTREQVKKWNSSQEAKQQQQQQEDVTSDNEPPRSMFSRKIHKSYEYAVELTSDERNHDGGNTPNPTSTEWLLSRARHWIWRTVTLYRTLRDYSRDPDTHQLLGHIRESNWETVSTHDLTDGLAYYRDRCWTASTTNDYALNKLESLRGDMNTHFQFDDSKSEDELAAFKSTLDMRLPSLISRG